MTNKRTQLNINIDPALLNRLKIVALRTGKTLTQYITEKLEDIEEVEEVKQAVDADFLTRLENIEKHLNLNQMKLATARSNDKEKLFSDKGAKEYGQLYREVFTSTVKSKGITIKEGLRELIFHLIQNNSNIELVYNILLSNHELNGIEMTNEYYNGVCKMRASLNSWSI